MSRVKECRVVSTDYLNKEVHINHVWDGQKSDKIIRQHLEDDVYDWYLVYESGHGNFPRVHLISAEHAEAAISSVWTYIQEELTAPEDLSELEFPITGYHLVILKV